MSAGDKRHGTPAITKRHGRLIASRQREAEQRDRARIREQFRQARRDFYARTFGTLPPEEAA